MLYDYTILTCLEILRFGTKLNLLQRLTTKLSEKTNFEDGMDILLHIESDIVSFFQRASDDEH